MEGKEIIDNIIIGRVEPYIYAFTTNTVPNYLKIGDTYRPVPIRLNEWKKYFPDLKEEYKEKAMINSDVFFRDYSVHKYVEEELGRTRLKQENLPKEIYYSNEFFEKATNTDVKKAIEDIKESYEKNDNKYQFYDANTSLPEIFQYKREEKEWQPRPNQKEAIENFKNARKNGRKNLLMYAVMRFGKSFTSMMCAKEMNADLVVIVSAKADVKLEWKKTVEIPKNFDGYSFITSEELARNNNEISERLSKNEKVAVFLTLQDLQGDLIKEKHKDVFKNKIDLLIVDETHFGARAEKYGKVLESTKYEKDIKDKHQKEEDSINDLDENIKVLDVDMTLHLSGTPYRILMGSEFEKEDIISFCQFSDIVEEQKKWNNENILNDNIKEWDNPYFGFPQMVRFAFNPSKKAKEKLKEYKNNGYTYAFSALLKPKSIKKADDGSHKKFVNEQEILELFEVIDGCKEDENVLGFLNYEKIKQGKMCRHIVCVLPYCASCDALEELIKNNKENFKNLNEYEIINISGVDNSNQYRTIAEIKDKIRECEENNVKTLTLTVNRMLTGSTVEEWDTMIYLKDTSSPQEYDQAIFRLQNQYIKKYVDNEQNVIKYNMKPQTLLVDFDPYRMFVLQEQKSKIYNVNVEEAGNSLLEERLKNELKISPIITINKNKIVEIEPKNIMDAVSEYSKEKGVMDEVNDIPVDLRMLDNEDIKNVIDKQAELGSSKGLSIDNTDDEDGDDLDVSNPDSGNNTTNSDIADDDRVDENNNIEEPVNYEKKIRTYFARVLFYSFLTEDKIISLSQIVSSIDKSEKNKRIARNLGLNNTILKLMNDKMDAFKLSQLDYKIQNINMLSKDNHMKPIERAIVAMNKFKKISQSEIVTPNNVCMKMIKLISKDKIIDIYNNKGKFLDIASKIGEFPLAIYQVLLELNLSDNRINDMIYAIPTSSVSYEFTRKIYEILGLNIKNIAVQFNTFNLLNIIDQNNDIDYKKIKMNLIQNKNFSEIKLLDNIAYERGENKMKFDVVVGNPPYQETVSTSRENASLGKQLFPWFVITAMELEPQFSTLITPSRWFTGDAQDKSFVKLREYIKENNHISKIYNFKDEKEIFENVEIKGGVNYFLYEKDYQNKVQFVNCYRGKEESTYRNLFEEGMDIIINDSKNYPILKKVKNDSFVPLTEITTGRNAFGIIGKKSVVDSISKKEKFEGACELRCKANEIRYIKDEAVTKNIDIFNSYKVFVSKSAGNPNSDLKVIGLPYIGEKRTACTDSLIPIGKFETIDEAEALQKYIKTKFLRFMVSILKTSQNVTQIVYAFVPMQDFTQKSDIDWSKSVHEIDLQLYKKYNLSDDEIEYIESKIKEME